MDGFKKIPCVDRGYMINESGVVITSGGKVVSQCSNGEYLYVNIYKNGKRCLAYVHRLVAITFIPNPENLSEVDHKDFNKLNNHKDNLQWKSKPDNIKLSFKDGRRSNCRTNPNYKGSAIPLLPPAKITNRRASTRQIAVYDLGGNLIDIYPSVSDVAEQNNLHKSTIRKVANGRYANAYGYLWKYVQK
jgi:hypothetical protein